MPLCEPRATHVIDLDRPHSFFSSRESDAGLSAAVISDLLAAISNPLPQRCVRDWSGTDTVSADLDRLTLDLLDEVWRLADELGQAWQVAGRG
jgi:hypothetical protein